MDVDIKAKSIYQQLKTSTITYISYKKCFLLCYKIYTDLMPFSLKKQIHKKKILNCLKTHDIVLFFARGWYPQKNIPLYTHIYNNVYGVPHKGAKFENFKYTSLNSSIIPHTGEFIQWRKRPFIILNIYNKSAKYVNLCMFLPFSGPTILIAFKHEQHVQCFTIAKPLYKGILLGGFYKNKYKTRLCLKTLCTYIARKTEIYTYLLKVISYTTVKNLRTTATTFRKYINFSLYLSQSKKKKVRT